MRELERERESLRERENDRGKDQEIRKERRGQRPVAMAMEAAEQRRLEEAVAMATVLELESRDGGRGRSGQWWSREQKLTL